ncbi:hypothetical protein FIV34_00550 [Luteibacter pinisoli]|jgi:hypothetical protein|uniref:Uncharacterized protein n=1 Tax=Luteibacter pinisoli TaxID=2589080 RepID=A0A4Y5YXT1_9GAMM|nr:hypothetical protein [Luteibacter pinisoli]QDE37792.1 hypothetical protein FIV34_00550 [Luteibacter pinisoli]
MPRPSLTPLAAGSSRMVCAISAGMVGVCLTGIGLLRVSSAVSKSGTIADDLLSFDAILFLVATLSAYFALRVETAARLHRLERVADISFILAMVLLTAVCFIITYMTL